MTQENKQQLLKDICARLPYGVYGQFDVPSEKSKFERVLVVGDMCGIFSGVCLFKPYLRPMSSMTEEEKEEFQAFHCIDGWHPYFYQQMCNIPNLENMFNWLNAHHFDYRGLIPMGLALKATEGTYKTE